MSSKSVLLLFGEQRKVCALPLGTYQEDYCFVLSQALQLFPESKNGRVVLQKYDKTWETWIDLDEGDPIGDRERLNILIIGDVTDICQDFTPGSVDESNMADEIDFESSIRKSTPPPPTTPRSAVASLNRSLTPVHQSLEMASLDTAQEQSACSSPFSDEIKLIQDEESLFNFSLPTSFPTRVEILLEKKEYLVGSACNQFVQTIAHSMYAKKKYPSSGEFEIVGQKLISKYPFLASAIGNKSGQWIRKLKDRFKSFRRSGAQDKSPPAKRSKKSILPMLLETEDDHSYKENLKTLRQESQKRNPNKIVVSKIMERTFPQRRRKLAENSPPISDMIAENPFLGKEIEIKSELRRIWKKAENFRFASAWKTWAPRVLKFAQNHCSSKAQDVVKEDDFSELNKESLTAVKLLPVVFPPSKNQRKKTTDIVAYCQADEDIDGFVSRYPSSQPIIVIAGQDTFIAAEKSVLFRVEDIWEVTASLISVYLVFNVRYESGHKSLLSFVEYTLNGETSEKMTLIAENIIAAMQNS